MALDPAAQEVRITGFKKEEYRKASAQYALFEKGIEPDGTLRVVLVSVSDIAALKRAYPNYLMDTRDFLQDVYEIVGRDT